MLAEMSEKSAVEKEVGLQTMIRRAPRYRYPKLLCTGSLLQPSLAPRGGHHDRHAFYASYTAADMMHAMLMPPDYLVVIYSKH
eukprot:6213198-Pleurochrysis_carterae.AAC.1